MANYYKRNEKRHRTWLAGKRKMGEAEGVECLYDCNSVDTHQSVQKKDFYVHTLLLHIYAAIYTRKFIIVCKRHRAIARRRRKLEISRQFSCSMSTNTKKIVLWFLHTTFRWHGSLHRNKNFSHIYFLSYSKYFRAEAERERERKREKEQQRWKIRTRLKRKNLSLQ